MPRQSLDRHIHQIEEEVLLLGSMVEQAMLKAVESLKNRDTVAAHKIYNDDRQINEKRFAIENAILILIATQQPMAHDLRVLTASLEVITELERMGDYAKGIAKVTERLGDVDIVIPIREIQQMAVLAVGMLHRALSAFVEENPNQARQICEEDSQVDELYTRVNRIITQNMIQRPETIDHTNLLQWVAHNLERMADRVSNICERTVFTVTGEMLELDSSDDEDAE